MCCLAVHQAGKARLCRYLEEPPLHCKAPGRWLGSHRYAHILGFVSKTFSHLAVPRDKVFPTHKEMKSLAECRHSCTSVCLTAESFALIEASSAGFGTCFQCLACRAFPRSGHQASCASGGILPFATQNPGRETGGAGV